MKIHGENFSLLLKIAVPLLLAFWLILALQARFSPQPPESQAVAKQPAPPFARRPDDPRIVDVTAEQLLDAYNFNEVAADEKMRGAIVAITGTVRSIDKNVFDSINITVETGFVSKMVFHMGNVQPATAATLQPGQRLTVYCSRVSRILREPVAGDCLFAPPRLAVK